MKFEIDNLVFIILAGKIVQGRIIEARKGERWIADRNNDKEYQEYEVYRVSKDNYIKNDYRNINPKHSYRGEYDFNDWFGVEDIFSTVDEALNHIKGEVDYIIGEDERKKD